MPRRIEPDIRGAKTIRDQLEKHRASADLPELPPADRSARLRAGELRRHRPLARALLRRASAVVPVDASGQFGATEFKDVTGFKKALLERREQFARCLVEKLLIHALGRELDVTDRPHIRKIVEASAADGYRLRDLILLCAESEIFRRK